MSQASGMIKTMSLSDYFGLIFFSPPPPLLHMLPVADDDGITAGTLGREKKKIVDSSWRITGGCCF